MVMTHSLRTKPEARRLSFPVHLLGVSIGRARPAIQTRLDSPGGLLGREGYGRTREPPIWKTAGRVTLGR